MSDDEKPRFGSLRVVHSLEASQRRVNPDPSPELVARWRSRRTHEHPLVWTHRKGRKSLVLGASADYVVGMDLDEGRALLAELLDRATRPDMVYRHDWSVGDTSSGTTAACYTVRRRMIPTHRGRCCAPRCSATNHNRRRDAKQAHKGRVDVDRATMEI